MITEENQPELAPQATDPSEPVIPQSKVNALIAQARREGREQASRQTAAGSPPANAQAQAPASDVNGQLAELQNKIATMEQRSRFDRSLIGKSVTPSQADKLFTLYAAERPESAEEWVATTMDMFGMGKQQQPTAQDAKPVAAPKDAIPKPVDIATINGFVPIGSLSPEQSRDPKLIVEAFKRNWDLQHKAQGIPPPPRVPTRK
jgi:hypothetical protein